MEFLFNAEIQTTFTRKEIWTDFLWSLTGPKIDKILDVMHKSVGRMCDKSYGTRPLLS